jgi:hypothetical protein
MAFPQMIERKPTLKSTPVSTVPPVSRRHRQTYIRSKDATKTQIANLHIVDTVEENILRLEISMQHSSVVKVLESLCDVSDIAKEKCKHMPRRSESKSSINPTRRIVYIICQSGSNKFPMLETHCPSLILRMRLPKSPPSAKSITKCKTPRSMKLS